MLVGLQSFAEGLDLKGDYLTQVHIHKIAFPPIDSPVVITEGEWLKSLNRYPFEVQSLPAASFNLIQQVGRLIRSHGCWGEVVIYDKRLLTKNYGQRLLNALPIFPIEQPDVPEVKNARQNWLPGVEKASVLRGAVLLVSEGHLDHAAERAGRDGHRGGVIACGQRERGRVV